jgi:hypothetical protein
VNLQGGRWCSNLDIYTTDSHKFWSKMMVFLGILDFNNDEGDSSIEAGEDISARWARRSYKCTLESRP